MSLLSAALRSGGGSQLSLLLPGAGSGSTFDTPGPFSTDAHELDGLEVFALMDADAEAGPHSVSPAASSPLAQHQSSASGFAFDGAGSSDCGAADAAPGLLHHARQQHHQPPPPHFAAAASAAWDVPAARAASASALMMSRSMPRPITGPRRTHSAVAADEFGGGGGGGFVPPHLASSLVQPQAVVESLSTAKGAAALRLRSQTLRRTGYLDGRLGGAAGSGGAGGARLASS